MSDGAIGALVVTFVMTLVAAIATPSREAAERAATEQSGAKSICVRQQDGGYECGVAK